MSQNRRSTEAVNSAAQQPSAGQGTRMGLYALPLMLAALVFLSACSSISEEECLAANWYTKGVEDGSKGYPLSRIGSYNKDCAEVGVAPDADQYNAGRLVGLESYCTYDRGYSVGKRGASNKNVCPAGHLANEFTDGYNDGYYVYGINQQIRGLESQLSDVRSEKAGIQAGLEGNYFVEEDGTKRDLTTLERRLLYDKLDELSGEEARLENEIGGLRASIAGS